MILRQGSRVWEPTLNYDTDRIKALKIEKPDDNVKDLMSFDLEEIKLIKRLAEKAVFYPEESDRDYFDGYVSLWEKVSAIDGFWKLVKEILN